MAIVNIATTFAPSDFPNGYVAGQVSFTLMTAGQVIPTYSKLVNDPIPATVSMSGVAPGTYTLVIQRLEAGGSPLGAPVSQTLVVPVPAPAVIAIPTGAVVTLA